MYKIILFFLLLCRRLRVCVCAVEHNMCAHKKTLFMLRMCQSSRQRSRLCQCIYNRRNRLTCIFICYKITNNLLIEKCLIEYFRGQRVTKPLDYWTTTSCLHLRHQTSNGSITFDWPLCVHIFFFWHRLDWTELETITATNPLVTAAVATATADAVLMTSACNKQLLGRIVTKSIFLWMRRDVRSGWHTFLR